MSREVNVELVDRFGTPVGRLPPFTVREPWWQDVTEVVGRARQRFGLEITVLRLLRASRPIPPGGSVTYLAEISGGGVDGSAQARSPDEPRRLAYARPGGPAATARWARAALDRRGIELLRQRQFRTWNLSAIWQLTTSVGELWLKEVPPILSFESTLVVRLGAELDGPVPTAVHGCGTRFILRHVDGFDCYGASAARRVEIASTIHQIHAGAARLIPGLLDEGLPDRRGERALAGLEELSALVPAVERHREQLRETALDRLAWAERDGLPPVLLHGDLHCGNVRSTATGHVILDWSNAFLGHPAFDVVRLTEDLPPQQAGHVVRAWAELWRGASGRREIGRSVDLLRPVHFLLRAIVCAGYLTNFEESEHKYHRHNLDNYVRLLLSSQGFGIRD
ncbi:phosphotransferase family protein [Micromonospora zhanjiangensis]|uniref:Phosphotransferase family protein n=1 Tax=Micromonospora zhanjiangensis TaxID=1522057 RepID=A0ABV8KQQ9_9ACTN